MIPGLVLLRMIALRQKQIRNGLPDAVDLLIVCIEAGSSLDQAVVKASEELGITYPVLAEELRNVNTEIRAGKPRLEAFKNFAERTKVDDVRALVAMLVQTDRFGTSVGAGASNVRGHRQDQAAAGRGGAGGQAGRQAAVPAGLLPVPFDVRGSPGPGGRSDLSCADRASAHPVDASQRRDDHADLALGRSPSCLLVLYLMRRRARLRKED